MMWPPNGHYSHINDPNMKVTHQHKFNDPQYILLLSIRILGRTFNGLKYVGQPIIGLFLSRKKKKKKSSYLPLGWLSALQLTKPSKS